MSSRTERLVAAGWGNFRMTVAYDGRAFKGWQRLRAERTVQGELEAGCRAAFGDSSAVQGAGRTDRGVHALGQVATVQLPPLAGVSGAMDRLNAALPGDVRVVELRSAVAGFHAREAAVGKVYRYVISQAEACPPEREGRVWHVPERLDVAAMRAAAPVFLGTHDFAAFAKRTRFNQPAASREIYALDLDVTGDELAIRVHGNSFLYRMVRNLVAALVQVGQHRTTAADLAAMLASPQRPSGAGTAPAAGLYLDRVCYPDSDEAAGV